MVNRQTYVHNQLIFKDYKIVKYLGYGGFGEVYKCVNSNGFEFAVKVMHEVESKSITGEKEEKLFTLLKSIKNPRFVKIIDAGWNDDKRFIIIMEYLKKTLAHELNGKKKGEKDAFSLIFQIIEILNALESDGLMHKDIKPENILFDKKYLKVGDYDLARFSGGKSKGLTSRTGTPSYMSPQRFKKNGDYGYETDWWAAACIFYEILSGDKAFTGEDETEIFGSIMSCDYDESKIDNKFHDFFRKAFRLKPQERHQSINEIKDHINSIYLEEDLIVDLKPELLKDKNKEIFINEFGMEFVWIKPGKFMMGSPSSEKERSDNEILHEVELTQGFYIMTTPVTQKMYEKLMGKNPSYFKDCPDNPVEQVSWIDAQKFIMKLNKKDKSFVYSLPTEAQWEYSCRAGSKTAFSWGNSPDCSRANFGVSGLSQECSGINPGETSPVKSYPPNNWGLYDMHGNVWEWCLDWYGDYEKEPVTNPGGPGSGSNRVNRGGCWYNSAWLCRSADRHDNSPGLTLNFLGFRVVASQAGR